MQALGQAYKLPNSVANGRVVTVQKRKYGSVVFTSNVTHVVG